ncbi:MAG TPA: hypothetical protein VJ521_07535, partial [Acidobacteriota bacterium]|nr:hypothetical protein [Acidobacteriota bacterium]
MLTFRWFRNKSLRFKINTFVIIFTVLMAGLGITMLWLAYHYLKEELIYRGQLMVRRLAESHAYQVSLGLADELKPIIDRMVATEQGIEYLQFVDPAGNIIHTSDRRFFAESDPARRPAAYLPFV